MTIKKIKYCDVLIVGGTIGGCTSAITLSDMGFKVILSESTKWIGGQLTSQGVPPDEHPWAERFGFTKMYQNFRNRIRQYYRENIPLLKIISDDPFFNPGGGYASRLCHDPRIAHKIILEMMLPAISNDFIELLLNRELKSAESDRDKVQVVELLDTTSGNTEQIFAPFYVDATDLGDLLPLINAEYVVGSESINDTQEPHAKGNSSNPDNVQAFTWPIGVGYDENNLDIIEKPQHYNFWRDFTPKLNPPWNGKLLDWKRPRGTNNKQIDTVLFSHEASSENDVNSIFNLRQVISKNNHPPGTFSFDVTTLNCSQNDFFLGNIIDKTEKVKNDLLFEAKQLSLSFLYWLQTEAPRPNGGFGYPGLFIFPDLLGSNDGFSLIPYTRESRRIKSVSTVTERHVSRELSTPNNKTNFKDSVGLGFHKIDLHPTTGGDNYLILETVPYQIPLGCLIPERIENMLPACKNIGTTHITNGCYRLHHVEWNIGESVGSLIGYCLLNNLKPQQVLKSQKILNDFQSLILKRGINIDWPDIHEPLPPWIEEFDFKSFERQFYLYHNR